MQRLIILRGYPGSGKSTVGKKLQMAGLGIFIDHNSILNVITSITHDDKDIYQEIHELEKAMARKLLDEGNDVIVARGFSSPVTIDEYIDVAKSSNAQSMVMRLQASPEVLAKRVSNPDRKLTNKHTLDTASLTSWMDQHKLEDFKGEIMIDVERDIDEVVESISSNLNL